MYLYIEGESNPRNDEYVIKDTADGSYETYTKEELLEEMSSGVKFIGLPFSGKQANLAKAKAAKNDEFYTQMSDIETELKNYDLAIFKDKIIYLPADVALQGGRFPVSEFVNYFKNNAETLDFKELIASCLLNHVEQSPEGYNCYSYKRTDEGYKSTFSHLNPDPFRQSGDFRSKECTEILKKSDIVVTNPPFSLFREFIAWLKQDDDTLKPCIIVGSQNAIQLKGVFPLIRDNILSTGYTGFTPDMYYSFPEDLRYAIKDSDIERAHAKGFSGNVTRMGNTCWFTTEKYKNYKSSLFLCEHYYEEDGVTPLADSSVKYPKYDDYDAINVDKIKSIPVDYYGVMGVPITFIDKYDPNQFDIVAFRRDENNVISVYTRQEERGSSIIRSYQSATQLPGMIKSAEGKINGRVTYGRVTIRRKLNQ